MKEPEDVTQLGFDLLKGRHARDDALGLVEMHFRKIAAARGLTVAKNAWGAVFRGPGWRKVGERPSALVSNKGHVSPEWTWEDPA